MRKKLNKKNSNELFADICNLINSYYSKIGFIIEKPIMLINLSTLIIMAGWNADLDLFNELIEKDLDFKNRLFRFLNDNLLHYSATIKFKEQIDRYQQHLAGFEEIDVEFVNDYDNSIYENQIDDHIVSANTGDATDLDPEKEKQAFKDIKVY